MDRRRILGLGLTALITWPGTFVRASENGPTAGDLEKRGKELHAALERAYTQLASAGQLSTSGTDAKAIVLPYFPPETSFDDAETTLRNAGFVVGPHPVPDASSSPNKGNESFAVGAWTSPFAERNESASELYVVYVTLLPTTPGDYTTVSQISARFVPLVP